MPRTLDGFTNAGNVFRFQFQLQSTREPHRFPPSQQGNARPLATPVPRVRPGSSASAVASSSASSSTAQTQNETRARNRRSTRPPNEDLDARDASMANGTRGVGGSGTSDGASGRGETTHASTRRNAPAHSNHIRDHPMHTHGVTVLSSTTPAMLPPPSLGPELHDALDRVLHPQFRCKAVCELRCKHCARMMCQRGMKAILLASSKPGELRVELFSTDSPPPGAELFGDDYTTASCRCLIRDAACLGCGNTVAYNVTKPCATCLQACNNGHLWVLHADSVSSTDRLDTSGRKILRWADLPPAETDGDMAGVHEYSLFCR